MLEIEEIKKAIDCLEGDELVRKVWQLMNTAWKDGMRYGLASDD